MQFRIRLNRKQKTGIFAFILLLPAIFILGLTIVSPLVKALIMSFQNYSLMSPVRSWNGFANYLSVLKGSDFYHSFKVTIVYVFIAVVIEFILGLALALLLNRNIMMRSFFRSIIMIPWSIPTIVSALIFMWMFQVDYGVINYFLVKIGVVAKNIHWLTDMNFALIAIIIVAVWRQTPLMGLMLLAGLQNIPQSLREAARIDGAGPVQTFFRIVLPSLKPVIGTVTLLLIVTNFQMFTLFFTLTGGGPVDATKSLAILTYETAFEKYDLGKASAIGVIWLVLLFSFSSIYTKVFNRGTEN